MKRHLAFATCSYCIEETLYFQVWSVVHLEALTFQLLCLLFRLLETCAESRFDAPMCFLLAAERHMPQTHLLVFTVHLARNGLAVFAGLSPNSITRTKTRRREPRKKSRKSTGRTKLSRTKKAGSPTIWTRRQKKFSGDTTQGRTGKTRRTLRVLDAARPRDLIGRTRSPEPRSTSARVETGAGLREAQVTVSISFTSTLLTKVTRVRNMTRRFRRTFRCRTSTE